jgi:hypothetical protein
MSSNDDFIYIENGDVVYKIPSPNELQKNMNQYDKSMVIIEKEKGEEMESKDFFISNPEVFQIYMEKMVESNNIPNQFYMYVQSILEYIKHKYSKKDVDNYWKKML